MSSSPDGRLVSKVPKKKKKKIGVAQVSYSNVPDL